MVLRVGIHQVPAFFRSLSPYGGALKLISPLELLTKFQSLLLSFLIPNFVCGKVLNDCALSFNDSMYLKFTSLSCNHKKKSKDQRKIMLKHSSYFTHCLSLRMCTQFHTLSDLIEIIFVIYKQINPIYR